MSNRVIAAVRGVVNHVRQPTSWIHPGLGAETCRHGSDGSCGVRMANPQPAFPVRTDGREMPWPARPPGYLVQVVPSSGGFAVAYPSMPRRISSSRTSRASSQRSMRANAAA